jgi:cell division protein ZapA
MEKNSVKVNILGSEYALKSDADPEYVSDLASYVDQKMQKLQQGSSIHQPLKIAVLTAVNISDELFRLKRKYEKLVKEIESASEEITENLDSFLNQYSDLVK